MSNPAHLDAGQLCWLSLQRGETVLPKNMKSGGSNITFNITTPNAQSFMDSQGQIMSKMAGQMQRFRTRNN